MTNDSMTVMQAVQQVGDEDLLWPLAEVALVKLMAFEVDGLVGAAKGKHTSERTTCRNGYRERPLHTRLGTLELRIPKLRQGTYFPSFLEPRRLSERALTAVIQEAWVGVISPRKVDDLVQALSMTGISKSQVSEWLFLRFRGLGDQHAEQGRQEMFASNTGIVHELEKAQVPGQLLL